MTRADDRTHEEQEAKYRRVVTALRLLRDDARGSPTEVAGRAAFAADELRRLHRRRSGELLEALARHLVRAVLPCDTFLILDAPAIGWDEAWRTLEGERDMEPRLPELPALGEEPDVTLGRVLTALEVVDVDGHRTPSLRAQAEHARAGALERWRRELARLERGDATPGTCVTVVRGLAAAHFDRGSVGAVRELLERASNYVEGDLLLGWMRVWALLLTGHPEEARAQGRALAPWSGRLPQPLVELRARRPEHAGFLSGRVERVGRAPRPERCTRRQTFSASVLGVFALGPGDELIPLLLEAAPGLGDGPARRSRLRDGAWRRRGEPEHELCTRGALIQCDFGATPNERRAGALGGELSTALALVPILDEEREVAGWLHVECEHGLLPAAERLASVADAWSVEVLAARRTGVVGSKTSGGSSSPATPPRDDPRRRVGQALLSALELGCTRRRLLLLDLDPSSLDPAPEVVAELGTVLADRGERPGGGRALRRAWRTRTSVAFDEKDPSMGLHAASASGEALPLEDAGRIVAFLVAESVRAKDLPLREPRIRARLPELARAWRAAQFRSWHLRRFGYEPHFDPAAHFWSARAPELRAAAHARTPLYLHGPPGAGKELLARLLHFEGRDSRAPLASYGPDAPSTGRGTWLVEARSLDATAQRALQRRLVNAPLPRIFVLGHEPVARAVEAGTLVRELAELVGRFELELPALRDRRDEIPGLVGSLARRFAAEEGVESPRFADDALGLLWRQPWPGNVRELEGLVLKLVLTHPGRELFAADIVDLASRFRLRLRSRLPSLRPRSVDLAAALRTTRHACGSENKARAARYLGWDPDTLAARLRDRAGRGRGKEPGTKR